LRQAARGRDVFVYFNNDRRAAAVRNANTLRELLRGRKRIENSSQAPASSR